MVGIPGANTRDPNPGLSPNLGAALQLLATAAQANTQLLGQIYTAINTKFPNWVGVPATAASTGTAGQVAYDATHFYVCIATNTWVRVATATF